MHRRLANQPYSKPATPSQGAAVTRVEIPVCRVRLVKEGRLLARPTIEDPKGAAQVIAAYLADVDREHFVVLMLNTQNQLLGIHTAGIGTLTCVLVSPREVFKAAILANAASVIVGHNHPSGDPTPSPEDIQVTATLRSAGKILDIKVLDHVVVGERGRFASIKRLGVFDCLSSPSP